MVFVGSVVGRGHADQFSDAAVPSFLRLVGVVPQISARFARGGRDRAGLLRIYSGDHALAGAELRGFWALCFYSRRLWTDLPNRQWRDVGWHAGGCLSAQYEPAGARALSAHGRTCLLG